MQKIKDFINKHTLITLILMSLILGLVTIFFASSVSSLLYKHFATYRYVNDANTFFYIGKLMAMGKTPYIEFFDHKGLYLFYYAMLGHLLGGRVGFYFVQSITMAITYFFIIVSLKEMKTHKFVIFSSILLFLAIYCFSMQSPGDYEIQLPFITVMIYFYLRAINRNDDKSYVFGNCFAGLAAGVAINIRASDAMVPFAFVIAFFVLSLKNKKIKSLFFNALVCVLALLIMMTPPFIHSVVGGFSKEMYQSIILDNFNYVGSSKERHDASSFIPVIVLVILLVVFYLLLILNRKKISLDELLIYAVSGGVLFLIQFAIAYYIHYLFIMISYLFIIIARLFSLFFEEEKKWHISFKIASLVIAITSMAMFPTIYYSAINEFDQKVINYIDSNIPIEERRDGKVLCLQTSSAIYLNTGIINGYPDFCCQYNHVNLSKYYTLDRLITYLKSGECHYVISWENQDQNQDDTVMSWFNTDEGKSYYIKIVNDGIDIYQYI